MPRDTIPDQHGMFDVQVVWSPDSEMQVGVGVQAGSVVSHLYSDAETLARVGAALEPLFEDRSWMAALSKPELAAKVLDSIAGAGGRYTALYATLERPAANRLVRSLKRARNAVFGADE